MSNIFTGIYYTGEPLRPMCRTLADTHSLLGATCTLSFATNARFCIGWHDLATGENHPCPEQAATSNSYDTCPACQKRTGFNPAFYHAASISPQQAARNAQPHILYLAYMGGDYVKVGISWAKRGIRRLLDQGARGCIVLDTFPTALIARQYEAKIAALTGLHETTPTTKKLQLLAYPVTEADAERHLHTALATINRELSLSFTNPTIQSLTQHYTTTTVPHQFTVRNEPTISGTVTAIVGDIIFTNYDDRTLALPLGRYTGYPLTITQTLTELDLPAEQISLF
ncbi:MAG: DUF2797 domain-containing protein [Candidatus Saccharibacteria bacterium]|nr:DUF2797 domain-containing protein [Candidatus Saccharibacteria bacterium]